MTVKQLREMLEKSADDALVIVFCDYSAAENRDYFGVESAHHQDELNEESVNLFIITTSDALPL